MASEGLKLKELDFKGRLITSQPSALIGSNFKTLKNMRYTDSGIETVLGHLKLNTTRCSTTYRTIKSMAHYSKKLTNESYLLAHAKDYTSTAGVIYKKTIGLSDFTATPLFTETSGASQVAKWCQLNDDIIMTNGIDAVIWSGDTSPVSSFIVWTGTDQANQQDRTAEVRGESDTDVAYAVLSSTNAQHYIGFTRPISAINYTITTANATAATLAVKYWNGSTWTAVGGLSDGTASGGKTFAQTGVVSFTDTTATAEIYALNGLFLYWYQIQKATGTIDATTAVRATVTSSMQSIKNIWSGESIPLDACIQNVGTVYQDDTVNVYGDDYDNNNAATFMNLGGIASGTRVLIGSTQRLQGFETTFVSGAANSIAATITIKYWNGSAFTTINGVQDLTSVGGASFAKSGLVFWENSAYLESETRNADVTTKIGLTEFGNIFKNTEGPHITFSKHLKSGYTQPIPLYFYEISFSATFSSNVKVNKITAIPAPCPLSPYDFSGCITHANRLWLYNASMQKNLIMASELNTSQVFNGSDSIEFELGDANSIIGAASIVDTNDAGIEPAMLWFKEREIWLMTGTSPSTLRLVLLHSSIGCNASETIQMFEIPEKGKAVVWQSSDGIWLYHNKQIIKISSDIENLFQNRTNVGTDTVLSSTYSNLSVIGVDESRQELHWLFRDSSDSTNGDLATDETDWMSMNRELVYDYRRSKWFEIDRTNASWSTAATASMQSFVNVYDATGNKLFYGASWDAFVYQLDYNINFDGVTNTWTMQTGDMPLEGSALETAIREVIMTTKAYTSNGASGTLSHYGDSSTTVSTGTLTCSTSNSGYSIKINRLKPNWANKVYHSFKLTGSGGRHTPLSLVLFYKPLRIDFQ